VFSTEKLFSKNLLESYFFCKDLQSYNSPAAIAGELFKPSTDSASLLVEIEKIIFRFGFGAF